MIDITREEAIFLLGSIQGDTSPWGRSIRQKLLNFLTMP